MISNLNIQITALDVRISALNDKAQSAVKSKNRIAALAALKSKKAAETTLAQRYESLSQLEGVYSKIEQASDQVALIRVMKGSAGVLRNLNDQVGGVEKVDDVVEGLREQMHHVDEVNQVLEEAGRESSTIDDDVVDEELEALEQQVQAEREEKEAEQIRRKFAELDVPKTPNLPTAADLAKNEQQEDSAVAEDVRALRRLSIEDDVSHHDRVDQASQNLAKQAT